MDSEWPLIPAVSSLSLFHLSPKFTTLHPSIAPADLTLEHIGWACVHVCLRTRLCIYTYQFPVSLPCLCAMSV